MAAVAAVAAEPVANSARSLWWWWWWWWPYLGMLRSQGWLGSQVGKLGHSGGSGLGGLWGKLIGERKEPPETET